MNNVNINDINFYDNTLIVTDKGSKVKVYDMSNELRIGNRILNYVKTLERQNLKKIYQTKMVHTQNV